MSEDIVDRLENLAETVFAYRHGVRVGGEEPCDFGRELIRDVIAALREAADEIDALRNGAAPNPAYRHCRLRDQKRESILSQHGLTR